MLDHLEVVCLLFERGAQLDLHTTSRLTALCYASFYNKIDIARYLCERGANTLLKNPAGTPYALACRRHGVESPMSFHLEAYPH